MASLHWNSSSFNKKSTCKGKLSIYVRDRFRQRNKLAKLLQKMQKLGKLLVNKVWAQLTLPDIVSGIAPLVFSKGGRL